ncbi:MAG TPA: NADPH-dependent F420 reductase [Anaerolineae bacterium]|nr:NADPH-dependent F420 reductase [Anaerolineae bacterium]
MTNSKINTLAILGGTGNLGPGLALRWAHAGYKILIGSRQQEKAQSVADELNTILGTNSIQGMENADAARQADIGILTVKASAHQAAIESLQGTLDGKILVDTTARVDFRDPHPPDPPSAPARAQEILGPEVRVVAAFQTIPAKVLPENLGASLDMDVLVCADDRQAADEVIQLVEAVGFHAYDVGNLENAITLEGLVSLLIAANKNYQSKKGSIRLSGISK